MSARTDAPFQLDPRLAADTVFIADQDLCRVLLVDDARFPWLVLVPRRMDVVELDDLAIDDQTQLLREINHVMAMLRSCVPCDKLNIGALGNVVRQLHVHVVARRRDDAAWPAPVWGHGAPQRYAPDTRDRLRALLNRDVTAIAHTSAHSTPP